MEVDAAAKAARAGALRAHTHSLTLPAEAEPAGDVPSRRARIHCARAPSLSIHSVWGGAGLQVLNVASLRTRTRIWQRFRKAQVLYAHVIYWQMHVYGTILHIYCISDILFVVAYIVHIVYMLHIYCILHIVHILHMLHILHIM